MLLVKHLAMPEYQVTLWRTQDQKYQIKYKILDQDFTSEEIDHFEFATLLFDLKLQELANATSTSTANL